MEMPPGNYLNFLLWHSLLQKIRDLNAGKNLCHQRRVGTHVGKRALQLWHKWHPALVSVAAGPKVGSRLFTPWLDGRDSNQIRRQVRGLKSFDFQGDQTDHRDTELHISA